MTEIRELRETEGHDRVKRGENPFKCDVGSTLLQEGWREGRNKHPPPWLSAEQASPDKYYKWAIAKEDRMIRGSHKGSGLAGGS